jgi:acetyltransferase
MISPYLINPASIAVIGGSENKSKPGGKIISNLIASPFSGELFIVNPKAIEIQGLRSYHAIADAPTPDLAILAIPARFCPLTIRELCERGTRAFIVISAGFGELDEEGKQLDVEILQILDEYGASMLGPNCIGLIHENHHSVFTTPVPNIIPEGIEFISSSGSTAVFLVEAGMSIGIPFSNIFTVGNALQIRVEDLLEYLDDTYIPGTSSRVIMIYIENIHDPQKFIRHAQNLGGKGANIVALKAGTTDAGNRAASSHTGAMASPSVAVRAMFKKAGVLQCYSREELLYTSSILLKGKPKGRNIAVITHAGGAGVLLTDALEKGGLRVPEISGKEAEELLEQLFPGSSVKNPIDFLATGTKEQLAMIMDYCDKKFDQIDAMAVIFGSPGLFDVDEVYEMLHKKMKILNKPVYPILPSPINNKTALSNFIGKGDYYFPEETRFGEALAKVVTQDPMETPQKELKRVNKETIRQIIDHSKSGYLDPARVKILLEAVGIPVVREYYVKTPDKLEDALQNLNFPIVMKVIGPVHKSDVGGVVLNIGDLENAKANFAELMRIKGAEGVLIQPMLNGKEIFIGAKREGKFGHLVLFGMGGIFLEVLKDVRTLLTPLSKKAIQLELSRLKLYPVLKGMRGQDGIDLDKFADMILKLGNLVETAPEILELDVNPLLASAEEIVAVDARIRLI